MALIMKIKKILLGCLATALLIGIQAEGKFDAYAVEDSYEYEENNDFETANIISLGQSVTGTIEKSDDVDYYMVSPSADGRIEINFCHTYADSYADWNVYIYVYKDGKYTELSSNNIDLNANEKVKLPDIGAVKNEIYYVKVQRNSLEIVGENYTIQTSFLASDYMEKEVNNTYATATDILLNSSYSGTINNPDDKDYYKIVASQNGRIMLSFHHVYVESYADWNVYVYLYKDGQYIELSNYNIDLNANEKVKLPDIGAVKNGIYYIKVERNSSEVIGENYTIQTAFKASEYMEKEVNDTYASATILSVNHVYGGTINSYNDKDYYKIVAPKDGIIDFDFGHTHENSYAYWNVCVYEYSNGEYKELSSTNINLNANKKVSLPRVWGNKNGIYYVKIERGSSDVVAKNYTLKAKFYTYAPAGLKITTKKSIAKLTWTSAYDADGYEIYYKVGKSGTYKKLTSTTKTSYSYKKLAKGKTYYFKVRAYKKVGNTTYYSTYTAGKSAKRK